MPSVLRRLALPIALATLLLAAPAARAQYRIIETDDLRLAYPPTLGFMAPYTARCFENSLRFHRKLWNYTPSEKVNLILDDVSDYGNAGVWVSPRNSMVVHVAPTNFVYETGPSNERINFVMNHEVVHVLTADMSAGGDRLYRGLLHGKVHETNEHPETIFYAHLTMPRRATPRWYREGIAVFMETWMAGGLGRAQGPYDEMVFRAMVRDSSHFFDPLGIESEGTRIDFQVGVNSYLYGTRFMTYLAEKYSPQQVLDWNARHDGSRRYFASQFKQVFGKSLSDGWNDWIAFEHRFQQANLDSVRLNPTSGYRDLSTLALGSVSRAFVDSASQSLVAAVYRPGAVAQLASVPLSGGVPRTLHEIKGPALYFVSSIAYDPDHRLIYFTTDNNDWRDLRVYDLATGRTRLLIHDARIGDLAFDRATGALWAVRHFNAYSSIVRLQPPYRNWRLMWSLPYGTDAYDLDVSPDGSSIAASFADISGRQTLRLMNVATLAAGDTTTRTLHDFGIYIPSGFVFAPDGRSLFGSSYNPTGVSNIFRYELARDSMEIVSNAETGFFRPVPTGEDSLIVFRYSGQGFTPARILAKPLTDVSSITFLGQLVTEDHPELKTWVVPSPFSVHLDPEVERGHPYRALASVRLATLYPIVEGYKGYTGIGWNADISDPLSFHEINLTALVTPQPHLPDDERLHLSASYHRFDLTAQVRWNPASFYDLGGPVKSSRKGFGQLLTWHRTMVQDSPRSLVLTVNGSHWGGLERLPDHQNVETGKEFDQLLAGSAQLRYRNLRQSIGAPDLELGHSWWLEANENGVRFARPSGTAWNGFPFLQGGLDVGHPIPGLFHHSIWLRTSGGIARADREQPFSNFYFGGFGNNWLDTGDPKRYRDSDRFPGSALDEIAGTNYLHGMVDWNLPALRFRRAGTLALYASWVRLGLFAGVLKTNIDDAPTSHRLTDAGAQADLRMQLLTQTPLTLSVGWARAFEKNLRSTQAWMVSLKVQ